MTLNMATTFETLQTIITETFDKDLTTNITTITPETTLAELNIESLEMFDLIFAVEDAFDISVPNDQLDITTVQDIINLVERLCVKQGKI
jgi:acyl carrier protein